MTRYAAFVFEARPAARIESVRYAINNIAAAAARLEAAGRSVLRCNIGDPLQFGFSTPPHLVEAVTRAMQRGENGYGPPAGLLTAREAVVRETVRRGAPAVDPSEVVITSGVSEAIELALTALLDPGDAVLLPAPGYPLYDALAAKLEAQVIPYYLDEDAGWSIDVAAVEAACTPRTRALVICNPNNPTGGVYDRATLEALLALARRKRLVVLSDEIYDRFTYGEAPVSAAALAHAQPVITFNGLSKAHLVCGWRLGWMVFNFPSTTQGLRRAVMQLADARLCAPSPMQHAIAEALDGPQDHVTRMLAQLQERRALTLQRLSRMPGLHVTPPAGAFYLMPRLELAGFSSDEQFVLELLEETGVLFVHGGGFGQRPGTQHFRVVYLAPPPVLEDALDRLEQFLERRVR